MINLVSNLTHLGRGSLHWENCLRQISLCANLGGIVLVDVVMGKVQPTVGGALARWAWTGSSQQALPPLMMHVTCRPHKPFLPQVAFGPWYWSQQQRSRLLTPLNRWVEIHLGVLAFVLRFSFWDKVSLCLAGWVLPMQPGWLWTHDRSSSASPMLRLQSAA